MIFAYYNLEWVDSSWILPVFQAQCAEELEVCTWNRTEHTSLRGGECFWRPSLKRCTTKEQPAQRASISWPNPTWSPGRWSWLLYSALVRPSGRLCWVLGSSVEERHEALAQLQRHLRDWSIFLTRTGWETWTHSAFIRDNWEGIINV